MNLQEIEILIDKYEHGETSQEEENVLKHFFLNNDVPPHLVSYKQLFSFFKKAKDEEFSDLDFDEGILAAIGENKVFPISGKKHLNFMVMSGIAAGLIILIGLYFIFRSETSVKDTYKDPKLAYAETKKVLLMVSGNLNTGMSELKNVAAFDNGLNELDNLSTFDIGIQNLNKISALDKSKKIITSKNK